MEIFDDPSVIDAQHRHRHALSSSAVSASQPIPAPKHQYDIDSDASDTLSSASLALSFGQYLAVPRPMGTTTMSASSSVGLELASSPSSMPSMTMTDGTATSALVSSEHEVWTPFGSDSLSRADNAPFLSMSPPPENDGIGVRIPMATRPGIGKRRPGTITRLAPLREKDEKDEPPSPVKKSIGRMDSLRSMFNRPPPQQQQGPNTLYPASSSEASGYEAERETSSTGLIDSQSIQGSVRLNALKKKFSLSRLKIPKFTALGGGGVTTARKAGTYTPRSAVLAQEREKEKEAKEIGTKTWTRLLSSSSGGEDVDATIRAKKLGPFSRPSVMDLIRFGGQKSPRTPSPQSEGRSGDEAGVRLKPTRSASEPYQHAQTADAGERSGKGVEKCVSDCESDVGLVSGSESANRKQSHSPHSHSSYAYSHPHLSRPASHLSNSPPISQGSAEEPPATPSIEDIDDPEATIRPYHLNHRRSRSQGGSGSLVAALSPVLSSDGDRGGESDFIVGGSEGSMKDGGNGEATIRRKKPSLSIRLPWGKSGSSSGTGTSPTFGGGAKRDSPRRGTHLHSAERDASSPDIDNASETSRLLSDGGNGGMTRSGFLRVVSRHGIRCGEEDEGDGEEDEMILGKVSPGIGLPSGRLVHASDSERAEQEHMRVKEVKQAKGKGKGVATPISTEDIRTKPHSLPLPPTQGRAESQPHAQSPQLDTQSPLPIIPQSEGTFASSLPSISPHPTLSSAIPPPIYLKPISSFDLSDPPSPLHLDGSPRPSHLSFRSNESMEFVHQQAQCHTVAAGSGLSLPGGHLENAAPDAGEGIGASDTSDSDLAMLLLANALNTPPVSGGIAGFGMGIGAGMPSLPTSPSRLMGMPSGIGGGEMNTPTKRSGSIKSVSSGKGHGRRSSLTVSDVLFGFNVSPQK